MYSNYAALPPFPVIFRMLQALTLGRMADERSPAVNMLHSKSVKHRPFHHSSFCCRHAAVRHDDSHYLFDGKPYCHTRCLYQVLQHLFWNPRHVLSPVAKLSHSMCFLCSIWQPYTDAQPVLHIFCRDAAMRALQ